MTKFEEEFLEETLLSCLRDFEELEEQHPWFTTLCINRINKALRMLRRHDTDHTTTTSISNR